MLDNIATALKVARTEQKLTLRDVSDMSGLSISYLSDLERGRTDPSLATLRKLRGLLGIEPEQYKITYDELQLLTAWRTDDYAQVLRMVAMKLAHPKPGGDE